MRKSLMYSFCIGIAFAGVHSSYAQYPDAKSLLGRLGVKIDEDGKPVADGSGGCLPESLRNCNEIIQGEPNCDSTDEKEEDECSDDSSTCNDIQGKLNCLSIDDKTCENRWNNKVSWPWYLKKYNQGDGFFKQFVIKMGMFVPELNLNKIKVLFKSKKFLTGVFGEDFVSEFLRKAVNQDEKLYTRLDSQLLWVRYDSLCKKYEKCECGLCECGFKKDCRKEGLEKLIDNAFSERLDCLTKCHSLHEELRVQIEICKVYLRGCVLEGCVPCDQQTSSLRESFDAFRTIPYESDPSQLSTAAENCWKKLENVPSLKDPNHSVRISFSEVQKLLSEYSRASSALSAAETKLKKCEGQKTKLFEEQLETELGNDIKEYRKLYGGKGACESYRKLQWNKKILTTTEPLTVKMCIKQKYYKDKYGKRKLLDESYENDEIGMWTVWTDLNIEIRLVIDTRTNELLEAFCDGKLILNGRVVTDFGDGLCIFKSKQCEDLIEDEK